MAKTLLCGFIGLCIGLYAQAGLAAYPAPWPDESSIGGDGQWRAFTFLGSETADLSSGGGDASTGGTSPSGANDLVGAEFIPPEPTAYVAYDSVNEVLFFRMRLADEPMASGVGRDGISDYQNAGSEPYLDVSWVITIDINADGFWDFAVGANGNSGGGDSSDVSTDVNALGFTNFGTPMHSGDDLVVYYNSVSPNTQAITPHTISTGTLTDLGELVFAAEAITQNVTGDGIIGGAVTNGFHWDFGTTQVVSYEADVLWANAWFVDLQIPLTAFVDDAGAQLVFPNTPISVGCSTTTSNTDPFQKDLLFEGSIQVPTTDPFPYLDNFTAIGDFFQAPYISSVSYGACAADFTLQATVSDTLDVSGSAVVDTIAWVRFEYSTTGSSGPWTFIDTDNDGMDGGTAFNQWTANFTGGVDGQDYFFRITVEDDQTNQASIITAYHLDITGGGCSEVATLASFADESRSIATDQFQNVASVYLSGHGYSATTNYQIAFFDSSDNWVQTQNKPSGISGELRTALELGGSTSLGLWHVVVYPDGAAIPGTYTASDPTSLCEDSFYVVASAGSAGPGGDDNGGGCFIKFILK